MFGSSRALMTSVGCGRFCSATWVSRAQCGPISLDFPRGLGHRLQPQWEHQGVNVRRFDPRVVSPSLVKFLAACQKEFASHLAGGAALSGVYLQHRLSDDADLFVHNAREHRDLVAAAPRIARSVGMLARPLRDAGTFVRLELVSADGTVPIDIVLDEVADIESPGAPVEEVTVESLTDLRANKLTCILSRSEPRDLVDLLVLDRAGFRTEGDLDNALKKDAGLDPAILAFLLRDFPVQPMPQMLIPLGVDELRIFRDELAERLRCVSVP